MKTDIYADYIIKNGKILTVNKNDEIKSAVAVKDNKILAVGSDKDMDDYINDATSVIDLKGRAVTPGFNEAHIHFNLMSLLEAGFIIPVIKAKSIEEIKSIIKKAVSHKKPGEWIYLDGYDHTKLKEQRHPTRWDFDEVSPDNPVQCTRICHHMRVYNTYAIELANVDDSTEFENPNEVVRTSSGKLTGLFKESMQAAINNRFHFSKEDCLTAYKKGMKLLHSFGVTSIHEMGDGTDNYGRNVLQNAVRNREIKERFYMIWCNLGSRTLGLAAANHMIELGPHTGIGNEWYKMGPLKILMDGSTSGPSAYMNEPFEHDKTLKGVLNFPNQDEINDLFLRACKEGFQITAHAVGDGAIDMMLDAYEYVNETYPIADRRFKIEHCGFASEENIKRIKKLGIIPVSNPSFFTINGKDYNTYYGSRTNQMFPSASYQKAGIIECYGTDCPVSEPNPIMSLYGAVTRKDINNNTVCGESQKTDIIYAIRCITYNPAYASFEENIKGSIEPGKLADLVVLSEDILSCQPEYIKDIKVDITMIDGQIVYERLS
ncbi:MAG: amidohydrolase [Anaerovoracaceae bacterium]